MRILISFCLLLIISCQPVKETENKTSTLIDASPSQAGISDTRISRLDDMLNEAVKNEEVPGMVALVARNGKVVYHKAFGHADPNGREFKTDDIFRIASQSKAITATGVMILWEEGKFRLDEPISKWIPEFKNPQVLATFNETDSSYSTTDAEREITIRDLITHTSGIGYGVIDGDPRIKSIYAKAGITDLFTTEPVTIEESVKKLATLPLHHSPGEKWTYSEGLDVLGYFIEIVSGMPFDEFLRERLFDPIGMDDTWFYLPDDKADRLVPVQRKVDGAWEVYPTTFYDPDYPKTGAKTFFSGGAGLSSTALDYAKFLQMYLNGGEYNGNRILSRTTIKVIMANQIGDLWEGGGQDYGLAFSTTNEKGAADGTLASEGAFRWGGYFNTQYFADPEENTIGVLMKQTQGYYGDQTSWKFSVLIGQSIDD